MLKETREAIEDLLKYFDKMEKVYGRTPQVRDAKLKVERVRKAMKKEDR